MPFSFVKIEKDRSRVVSWAITFLVLFYFLFFGAAFFLLRLCFYEWLIIKAPSAGMGPFTVSFHFHFFTGWEWVFILIMAVFIAFFHWNVSTRDLVPRIINILRAKPPDVDNFSQKQFQNILEELTSATGGVHWDGFIIPTMAVNAFAIADAQGRQAIGVTRGLLYYLNRSQKEAVIAHEAAHILTGDALDTTLLTSLFSLPNEIVSDMKWEVDKNILLTARFPIPGLFSSFLLWILMFFVTLTGRLGNFLISRQREYRADAIAVRLTRDPRSLAEGLYLASRHWSGAGIFGEKLSAIFIINPRFSNLEESESWWAELWSTHPPVRKRLSVLLDMAHANIKELLRALEKDPMVKLSNFPTDDSEPVRWLLRRDEEWEGPYREEQIKTLDWLTPEVLVKKMGENYIISAEKDPVLSKIVARPGAYVPREEPVLCPRCYVTLFTAPYEGIMVKTCHRCEGSWINKNDVENILKTREVMFSPVVSEIANLIRSENLIQKNVMEVKLYADYEIACPRCQNFQHKMFRKFYSPQYHVEVDECQGCGFVWFDKDELEVLQYLYEQDHPAIKS